MASIHIWNQKKKKNLIDTDNKLAFPEAGLGWVG